MRSAFTFLLCVSAVFATANAQQTNILAFEDTPGNPLQEYVKTYKHSDVPKEFTGSFYAEEEFIPGVIRVNEGEKKLNVFLRYNALQDEVELKLEPNEEKVYVLPRLENIVYKAREYDYELGSFPTADGDAIEGYVQVHHRGEKAVLISDAKTHMKDEVLPRSGYDRYKPAHLSVEMNYYLSVDGAPFEEVDIKEKDFRKKLSSVEMKEFFSENRVNSLEEVVQMLEFYEEQ